MLLDATGSTKSPCLQAGRWNRSIAASKELTLGKEPRQTRPTSIHLHHSCNRKHDPSAELSPMDCSHLPLHSRKGEKHTASHKAIAREWKQPRGITERRSNNTVCKEYKGNKSLQAKSRLLATYAGWFCPRSKQYQKPGQLFGDEKDDQIIPTSEKSESGGLETSNDYPERCQAARAGNGSMLQSQYVHLQPGLSDPRASPTATRGRWGSPHSSLHLAASG